MQMRILVTGGAGFIGSHLCAALLEDGHEVICLDDCSTGSKKNVDHLLDLGNFEFLHHDIINPIDVEVDQIFNLACPASPVSYQRDPVRTIQTNVLGITNMLDLARRTGARLLQTSTSEVYGDPQAHPQKEDYWGHVNPIGIRSCYDEGKRMAETLMMEYHRQHQVDIRIVRIFNTYGPQMAVNDGRVVSNFIVQALRGEGITIYGDGRQTRSFCYVSDMIFGLLGMMNNETFVGPVNLGNPAEFTVADLAQRVIQLTGSKSQVTFRPLPSDDPTRRKPDITLAQTKLGWSPKVRVNEGLEKTIDYFKEILLVPSGCLLKEEFAFV